MKKILLLMLFVPFVINANDEVVKYRIDISNVESDVFHSAITDLEIIEQDGIYQCLVNNVIQVEMVGGEYHNCAFQVEGLSVNLDFEVHKKEAFLSLKYEKEVSVPVGLEVEWLIDDTPIVKVFSSDFEKFLTPLNGQIPFEFETTVELNDGVSKQFSILLTEGEIKINGESYPLSSRSEQFLIYPKYFVDSFEVEPVTVWEATETYKMSFHDAKNKHYSNETVDLMLANNTSLTLRSDDGLYQSVVPLSRNLDVWKESNDGNYYRSNQGIQVIYQWYERNAMNQPPSTQLFVDDSSDFELKRIEKMNRIVSLNPVSVMMKSESTRARKYLYSYRLFKSYKTIDEVKLRLYLSSNYQYFPSQDTWTENALVQGYDSYESKTMYKTRKNDKPIYDYYHDNAWVEDVKVSGFDQYDTKSNFISRKLLSTTYDYFPKSGYTTLSTYDGYTQYTSRKKYDCSKTVQEPYITTCTGYKWYYQKALRVVESLEGNMYAICPPGWRSYYSSNFRTYRCKKYSSYSYSCEKLRSKVITSNDRTSACDIGWLQTRSWNEYRFRKVLSKDYAEIVRQDRFYTADGYSPYKEIKFYRHRRQTGWTYKYKFSLDVPDIDGGYSLYDNYLVYQYKKHLSDNYKYHSGWIDVESEDFNLLSQAGYKPYESQTIETSIKLYDVINDSPIPPSDFLSNESEWELFNTRYELEDFSDFSEFEEGKCQPNTEEYQCRSYLHIEYPTKEVEGVILKNLPYQVRYKSSEDDILLRRENILNSIKEEKWMQEHESALYETWQNEKELVYSQNNPVAVSIANTYLEGLNFKPYLYMDKHLRIDVLSQEVTRLSSTQTIYLLSLKHVNENHQVQVREEESVNVVRFFNPQNIFSSDIPTNWSSENDRINKIETATYDEAITLKFSKIEFNSLKEKFRLSTDYSICNIVSELSGNLKSTKPLNIGCN